MDQPDQPSPRSPLARRSKAAFGSAARWGTRGSPSMLWRVLVPLVFAMAGFLFVTSAESARGGDLRGDNATSLAGLVEGERDNVDALREQQAGLERQIDQLSGAVPDASVTKLQDQLADLRTAAGLGELKGPAVQVTLDDAPYDQEVPDNFDANDLVVHQQDLQAVANALWKGGADGMTLQGQRIVATTGIKCVGNTVLLQGVPYSPPYEFVAVGDVTSMVTSVNSSEYIDIYKQYTEPPVNIVWDLEVLPETTLPTYDGSLELEYAEPVS